MNMAVSALAHPPLWRSLAALTRLGLYHFWRQALPIDNALPSLLLEEARELLPLGEELQWEAVVRQVQQNWPPRHGVLARFIGDYALTLPESLLLTLVGEVERSHLVSLVLAELQAPDRQPRPTVHLCCALFDTLFTPGTLSPLSLQDSALLRSGLLQLDTELPLPLRSLRIKPGYWSVFLEQARSWPHCSLLEEEDEELLPEPVLKQLPLLAELLAADNGVNPGARGLILRGYPHSGRRLLAQVLAQRLQRRALLIPLEVWQQEPALSLACRYGQWLPVLQPTLGPGEVWRPTSLPEGSPLLILLGSDGAVESPHLLELALPLPNEQQRVSLWQMALHNTSKLSDVIQRNNPASIEPTLAADLARSLAASALLSGPAIASLASNARLLAKRQGESVSAKHVTQARRQLGAERLRLLAQPVERQIDIDAIVLSPLVGQELERLLERARQRESLWHGLGTTLTQTGTAGVRALFSGDSGTGKTLAASYIATRLGAPLYRVDLSAVMNKYIGESEKNLSALLDMAAASDVILLFDEADSLFGRRTEGKETGERFANMLTHFLLTRIENHPGIVILTSNNRERIDAAFTRRLDLIVEFPQPGFDERLSLWRSHLGTRGPGEAVYQLLASHCNFAGGQLRNVVLTAAACADAGPIRCHHLLTGLNAEYRKIGRDLPAKLNQLALLEQVSK